jgi:hypothetical protein
MLNKSVDQEIVSDETNHYPAMQSKDGNQVADASQRAFGWALQRR